jgi:hypothetical protein
MSRQDQDKLTYIKTEDSYKIPKVSFVDVHPNPGRSKSFKSRDLPPWGGLDGLESTRHRCKQCGVPVWEYREVRGSGYGNQSFNFVHTNSRGVSTYDPVDGSGCWFCGSSEF